MIERSDSYESDKLETANSKSMGALVNYKIDLPMLQTEQNWIVKT